MTRPYLLAMACGAFAATAIVAAVCWVVDPLGIYDSPRIEGFDALKPALKTRSRVFKTVKVANGKSQVLNGPYADTKEQLGGYYLIDVPDLDSALKWAARCPGASHGTIEVRPVWQ